MSQNSNQQLRKSIGLSAAVSTVVGILIGSGVFFKPQAIYDATNGGPGLGLLAWLIGGLITIAAGLTAAEISASIFRRNIWRKNRIFNRLDASNIICTSNSCSIRYYICTRMC